MSYKVRWAKSTLSKIEKQKNYIAYDSPLAAKNWAANIKSKKNLIKENPFLGRVVPEFKRSNYREIIIGNYALVYVVEETTIDIVDFRSFKQESLN